MAGLLAKEMGLPVERFIAATNINDIVPEYLRTGIFKAHPSKSTISNAMDVGNPSNFARILDLYKSDLNTVRKNIFGASFTDAQTIEAMKELFNNYNYIADPHGAVAYLGLKSYQQQIKNTPGIFLETADPAKFIESVEPAIGKKIHIPERLQKTMSKEKQAVTIRNHYDDLKNLLI
jgi:threonine synthase